ncbi:hypothetical protein BDV25DRAFT_135476 [Aspergillus avenaceus]|uniref:Uncharacterized protein n=1 Tax=Aspergillus avenaceus TaxID=36643 RepID=A0A5N6U870_ASPAV|nr:hypothetical protein BDV25DRAFT_135476 [Aspergillus avenaceus]
MAFQIYGLFGLLLFVLHLAAMRQGELRPFAGAVGGFDQGFSFIGFRLVTLREAHNYATKGLVYELYDGRQDPARARDDLTLGHGLVLYSSMSKFPVDPDPEILACAVAYRSSIADIADKVLLTVCIMLEMMCTSGTFGETMTRTDERTDASRHSLAD